jgi:hypothetical protein
MARREPSRRTAQRQSLHFSVLKVLGRAAIDTPAARRLGGNGARAISFRGFRPRSRLIPGTGRGPLAQVVRAHG